MALASLAWVAPAYATDADASLVDEWAPGEVLPGKWTALEVDSSDVDPDGETCQEIEYGRYSRDDSTIVQVLLLMCPSSSHAASRVSGLAGELRGEWPNVEVGEFLVGANSTEAQYRAWAQDELVIQLNISCDGGLACADEAQPLVDDLQRRLPGELVPLSSGPAGVIGWALQLILTVWLLMIVAPRAIVRLFEPRLRFPKDPPQYMHVGTRVSRLRLVRVSRRFVIAVLGLALLSMVSAGLEGRWGPMVASGAVAAALGLASRWIDSPLLHPHYRGWSVLGPRAVAGWLVSATSVLATFALFVGVGVWLLATYQAQSGNYDPVTVEQSLSRDGSLSSLGIALAVFALAVNETVDTPELWLFALALALVVIGLLDRLGRRLRARSAEVAMQADSRPPVLYLRSFDEDQLKVRASLSRLGVLERLSPRRTRRFEEILARHLSIYGPLIAISPPTTRLAPLGAARVTLDDQDDEEWKSYVRCVASRASLVVMSATPDSVRGGLAWEQEHLAREMPHRRLILVVGPHKTSDIARRWQGFAESARRWTFFNGLPAEIPSGTHLLTPQGDGFWRLWGAMRRWDWSYGVAFQLAGGAVRAGDSWPAFTLRSGTGTMDDGETA